MQDKQQISLPRLRVANEVLQLIEAEARKYEDSQQETGGILVGKKFSSGENGKLDTVMITAATGPGPSAFHHNVEFELDTNFANQELERLRDLNSGVDFVGIWHKHPPTLLRPSLGDFKSARQMLLDPDYANHGVTCLINPIVVLRNGQFAINFYYLDRDCKEFVVLPYQVLNAPLAETSRSVASTPKPEKPETTQPSITTYLPAEKPPTKPKQKRFADSGPMVAVLIGVVMVALLIPLLVVLAANSDANHQSATASPVAAQQTLSALQTQNVNAAATQNADNQKLSGTLTVRAQELNAALAEQTAIALGTPTDKFLPNQLDGFSLKLIVLSQPQFMELLNKSPLSKVATCRQDVSTCRSRVVVKTSKNYLDYLSGKGKAAQVNFELVSLSHNETSVFSLIAPSPDIFDNESSAWYKLSQFQPEQTGLYQFMVKDGEGKWSSVIFEPNTVEYYLLEIS